MEAKTQTRAQDQAFPHPAGLVCVSVLYAPRQPFYIGRGQIPVRFTGQAVTQIVSWWVRSWDEHIRQSSAAVAFGW